MTQPKWPKRLSVSIAVSAQLCAGAVFASDPLYAPHDAPESFHRLSVGETAPFSGWLLTDNFLATVVVKAETCQEEIAIREQQHKEIKDLTEQTCERRLEIADKYRDAEYKAAMAAIATPPWYEQPLFVAAVSVGATLAVTWLAIQAAK